MYYTYSRTQLYFT